ncbi:hypothetical protein [Sphingomonas sp.]|uniref:hypothetical protein n=1 Tax=Sphingomonas sp. TaxID=28214 RepID=UPI002C30F1DC|nr:hypothetical protein [Sphingomonas sp.]HWK36528.1 hypothetical protein [Sphingomonas sp.]
MIDNFALAITHGLMLLAALRLWHRDDLDREPGPRDDAPPPRAQRWGRPRA